MRTPAATTSPVRHRRGHRLVGGPPPVAVVHRDGARARHHAGEVDPARGGRPHHTPGARRQIDAPMPGGVGRGRRVEPAHDAPVQRRLEDEPLVGPGAAGGRRAAGRTGRSRRGRRACPFGRHPTHRFPVRAAACGRRPFVHRARDCLGWSPQPSG